MRFTYKEYNATAELRSFKAAGSDVSEYHIMIHVEPLNETFEGQMRRLSLAEKALCESEELSNAKVVFSVR